MTVTRRTRANAIRALAMDAVQRAKSGHPGMPMGMADIAEVLWHDVLKYDPKQPEWPDRDRVVLSNGHGSMLQYAVLHLVGYDLPIEQLKAFRQLHSKTPGHPEYAETPGVETTTGPLGQGLANAVGMALAEKLLAARFNRDGFELFDHFTYVLLGDGCLMEGISQEAISFAGTQRLGKLIAIYDDNAISIDGEVKGWFTDDTPARFEACGWHVLRDVDGHDGDAILTALELARAHLDQPTLICAKTTIGFGSPNKAGTAASHGSPLGDDEVAATREQLSWHHAPFAVPDEIYDSFNGCERGDALSSIWADTLNAYRSAHPDLAAELERRLRGELPEDFATIVAANLAKLNDQAATVATRKASEMALNAYGPGLPELIGGSADLAGSNNTIWSGSVDVLADPANGNYCYFGVREFAMTAIANGLALHGGFIPYTATFLVFSDYARNAVRLSALMGIRNLHVYTHDSIGLGEDGPTHQPVEHLASLRLMPNLDVWRPADTVESAVAWAQSLQRDQGPSALVFTRQNTAHQMRDAATTDNIAKGGYTLVDTAGADIDIILIATGSELELARLATVALQREGINARLVSMPCVEVFARQPLSYREGVLPSHVRTRVAVEAGSRDYWQGMVGLDGAVIGLDGFGASAPAADLFEHFGITADHVERVARELIDKKSK